MSFSKNAIQADDNSDNSALLNKRLLLDYRQSEGSDLFNKTLASKHDFSKSLSLLGTRSARTPPTLAYPSHPTLPPPTSPTGRDMPSYSPPNRAFFTPPLPPEYLNPFAEKPTLRDSNSDGTSVSNKRPIPPPPPRLPSEIELIPIRPPDLPIQDTRKKTLNTPSFKKLAEIPYSETTSTTTTNSRAVNESFDFVPILPYPSVSRILSGGSGRKHDILQDILERPRFESESKASRTIKQEINTVKTLIPPSIKPPQVTEKKVQPVYYPKEEISTQSFKPQPTRPPEVTEEELRIEVTEPPLAARDPPEIAHLPELPEPRIRHVLGVAWDIHVYLIATLFAILAVCSLLNIIRISSFKRLLTRGYFLTLHGILLIIGTTRSVYLFYDAYNINHSYPEPVSHLLLNIVFPLLTSSFAILFLFLLLAGEIKMVSHKLQRASVLALLIIAHLILSVSVDLCANTTPFSTLLPIICQCLFVILCVALGLSYLYLYKSLSHSSLRKQGNIFGSVFSDSHRPTLAHAVRVTLATAMLSLLMAAVQLYGMFGVEYLGKESPHLWLWWGHQFSVRVIEVSMCFLMSWAGVQPLRCEAEKETQSHNSATGFALFACGAATPRGSEGGPGDDIYPAICSSNQAIHNYSIRTGKQVYDDTFPLNNLHTGPHMFLHNTTERRSLKKHPVEDYDSTKSICGTLAPFERRLQPSPSMLVAENGFVRFRSLADGSLEQPDDSYAQPTMVHPREDFT